MGEVLSLEGALRRRASARVLGQKFVFTNGCFDLIHPGHVALLREARKQGDFLMVAINSDRSVRGLKGEGRPVQNEADRAEVLAAMRHVDGVVIFDEETPAEIIEALKPDVLVKGGDYTPDKVVGREVVEKAGGRVHIVPLVEGKSSSALAGKP
ncbi:MAG TPA: D-glycero-beta-D-manno-heptose 1-phosphate adenylyltransferase [Candidatus Eisenbacteria bacterium]